MPLVALAAALWLCACGREASLESSVPDPTPPAFEDVTEATGLDFVHDNGMTGELYFAEIVGPGAILFDFDGDGDLDVFLPQGHRLGPGLTGEVAGSTGGRLFRNDSVVHPDGSVEIRFVDVTERSGIRALGYGMCGAVGDIDGDSWVDLYLTNFGSNQLWRNNGDGTFTDITAASGTDDLRWNTSATFIDFDGDGRLDLLVTAYIDFTMENHRTCRDTAGRLNYCGPLSYAPLPDRLFRNRGNGTFEDVSRRAGITRAFGAALGVIAVDLHLDGRMAVYVANDTHPNQLWRNQGDGTFTDEGVVSGSAVSAEGLPQAGMGVDAADINDNGLDDIVLTHLTGETNTLYLADSPGTFVDRSHAAGLVGPSWPYTGFGGGWIDFDNNGRLDLLVVNGAVTKIRELVRAGDPFPLHQRNQLFRNLGEARFAEISDEAGSAFTTSEVSRGAAFGDLDNDGTVDVVVANNHGPARVLANRAGAGRAWLGVHVPERHQGRARLVADLGEAGRKVRRSRRDGSYCAAQDPRIFLGLGDRWSPLDVELELEPGRRLRWEALRPGRYYVAEGLP